MNKIKYFKNKNNKNIINKISSKNTINITTKYYKLNKKYKKIYLIKKKLLIHTKNTFLKNNQKIMFNNINNKKFSKKKYYKLIKILND